jgi:hypothetical protein
MPWIALAGANYLEFLKEVRKAILEDAAILQDKYPKHNFQNAALKAPTE